MNPSVPQRIIDEALADDPARGAAEYLGEFRVDVESYIARESVEQCVGDYREIPPAAGVSYQAFCDPSGGSADSFTLAIGHRLDDVAIVDLVREVKPRFSPESVVSEFCDVLKSYRINKVCGDRYGGLWPAEQFAKRSIKYEVSAQPKAGLYQAFLPILNSKRIELPDDIRLINQICGLERRTRVGGKDVIDHAIGAHDDLANSVAGLAVGLSGKRGYRTDLANWVDSDDGGAESPAEAWARQQMLRSVYGNSLGIPFGGWR